MADGHAGGFTLYYSPRDAEGRAHVARATVEAEGHALAVARHEEEPVLSPGALGAFDDSGVTVSCVVEDGPRRWLYYTGWTLGVSVPFYFYAGLAVSSGDGPFERVSPAPILERSAIDPYLTASPCVLRAEGMWRMWYVSCVGWTLERGIPRHHYLVRHAESDDGVAWRRSREVALPFAHPGEYSIGRPCVRRDGGTYRMWYCWRGDRYRLGYAESRDGLEWQRMDERAGLEPSAGGWDAEMIAYPWIADVAGRRHMLYNGNGYGQSGIGYATEVTK